MGSGWNPPPRRNLDWPPKSSFKKRLPTLRRSSRRLNRALWLGIVGVLLFLGYQHLSQYGSVPELQTRASSATATATTFRMCGRPPHQNCVIDGDTFYFDRQSVRIADIDTPETNPARCNHEAELGARATRRLHELLNAGPFTLAQSGARDRDQYGRQLRIVLRDGKSLGAVLVAEGLARRWTGRRQPWC